jgi:hypothetical protein
MDVVKILLAMDRTVNVLLLYGKASFEYESGFDSHIANSLVHLEDFS